MFVVSSRRALTALVAIALGAVMAGCRDDTAGDAAGCSAAVALAAEQIETGDQLRELDRALVACPSYAGYIAALSAHPGLIGYSPETFTALRCGNVTDPALLESATCRVARPATTAPAILSSEPSAYVAATLDGRVLELRPSAAVPFTGDVPSEIQSTVDLANGGACPAVLAQRDLWAARATTDPNEPLPEIGLSPADLASVYAQHAIHVAQWIGCAGATFEQPPASAVTSVG